MRAFDELCASQGIDPRDLEEAFVSDNMALTAQNELLRQEVRGLRDALQKIEAQPGDDATLAVVSHQGADEEGDEDLNHVLSEAIDFVSTKTGFAVNLVKQKVANLLKPVAAALDSREELEKLREELAFSRETATMLSKERDELIVKEVERERLLRSLVGRLEACTDAVETEALLGGAEKITPSSTRKRSRPGGVVDSKKNMQEDGGDDEHGARDCDDDDDDDEADGGRRGKRQRDKGWRGGSRSISPIPFADDAQQQLIAIPPSDDVGGIGLKLVDDLDHNRVVVESILRGGTVDRCGIAISPGDFIVAVDDRRLSSSHSSVAVEEMLEGMCGSWVRVEVESKLTSSTSTWDIVRGTPEYLSKILSGETRGTSNPSNQRQETGGAPDEVGGHVVERSRHVDRRMVHMCARLIHNLAKKTQSRQDAISAILERESRRGKRVERDNARLHREVERLKNQGQQQQQQQQQGQTPDLNKENGVYCAAPSAQVAPAPPSPAPSAPINVHVHIHGVSSGVGAAPAVQSQVDVEALGHGLSSSISTAALAAAPTSATSSSAPPPPPPPPSAAQQQAQIPTLNAKAGNPGPPPPPPPAPSCSGGGGGRPDIAAALKSSPMFNRMKARAEA